MLKGIIINLTSIDINSALTKIYQFFSENTPKLFNWIVDASGGNPIVAGMLISFPVYLVIDFLYHGVLDKPAATIGSKMINLALNSVIFIMLFVLMYTKWNQ